MRKAFKMKLFPDNAEEYKRRHDAIWAELAILLKESGISEYSIYLDEETNALFSVMNVKEEEEAKLDELPQHPVMQRWWAFMSDIMETNPDHSPVSVPLQEVFYLP